MSYPDIPKEQVENFREILSNFEKYSNGGINEVVEDWLLKMLDLSIKFHSYLTVNEVFPEIERITINRQVVSENKRINEIKYLKYPPANKVKKYGRCNKPNQSVFYGTFNFMVAMNEMRPKVGDLITRSKWIDRSNEPLKFCPIFKNQPEEKDLMNERTWILNKQFEKIVKEEYPPNMQQLVFDLNQFVADSFSKRVITGNHRDYLFSAYFSDLILNKIESGSIDAIYYPSVKEGLSFENLAIKPAVFDDRYSLSEVEESVVVGTPTKEANGYSLEGISSCKCFDYTSDKILWSKGEITQPESKIDEYKNKYDIELSR